MFDQTGATAVETEAVLCPVLCLSGAQDRLVSLSTAKATAKAHPESTFWALRDHVHMLLVESGAERIAGRIADWMS